VNKSQLRKLAAEFADGRVPAAEYRTRRRELIDAIVAGHVAIEREVPPAPTAPAQPLDAAPSRRDLPWPLILAGASALCVALLVWLLWPSAPQPDEAPPPPVVLAPEVPRSRTLVESFLALRDFGAASIAQFESEWLALPETERSDARSQLWFRSLVRALHDEVKTQKALAGLTDGDAAMQRARRVVELAQRLGVAEQLPPLGDAPARAPPAATQDPPAPPADAQAAAPTTVPASPAASAPDTPPAATAPAPVAPSPLAALAPQPPVQPTGRQWLDARADDELTLQIFAVNALDRVEQLLSRHPDVDLHILATDGGTPRYRVFHGVFADADAARTAFAALPSDVAEAAGGAIVKSFAVVREDLQGRVSRPAAASVPAAAAGDYTLQVFASASRSNAQTLVDAFPALGLELREISGDAAPYRVVYGRFDSARDAAAAALPPALLSRIGKPLAKPVAETGVSLR
jgi:septal ring-binding cell division protein DamX